MGIGKLVSIFVISSILILSVLGMSEDVFGQTPVSISPGAGVPSTCAITDVCYIPSVVSVFKGEEVTWTNDDTPFHTVTSGTPGEGPDGIFDSNLILAGNTFTHQFTQVGSFPYFCTVHPWMEGTVNVDPIVPDAVTDLSAIVISGTQVDISWTTHDDGGSPITGYLIQRKIVGNAGETLDPSYGDSTTTSFSDTTLLAGDTVQYRIAAINAQGQGPYSNITPAVTTTEVDIITQILNSISDLEATVNQILADLNLIQITVDNVTDQSCPPGEFVTGIDSDGNIICNVP